MLLVGEGKVPVEEVVGSNLYLLFSLTVVRYPIYTRCERWKNSSERYGWMILMIPPKGQRKEMDTYPNSIEFGL